MSTDQLIRKNNRVALPRDSGQRNALSHVHGAQHNAIDVHMKQVTAPGLRCCTILTLTEISGLVMQLLYAAAAFMEIMQNATFEPDVWVPLLAVSVSFDAFWVLVYLISRCRYSRIYDTLAERHWKPSMHHLLIHAFFTTVPMITCVYMITYWTREQLDIFKGRYQSTYPIGLDVRILQQWVFVMTFILCSMPLEIYLWLKAMERHIMPKYTTPGPLDVVNMLQRLQASDFGQDKSHVHGTNHQQHTA